MQYVFLIMEKKRKYIIWFNMKTILKLLQNNDMTSKLILEIEQY